MLIDSGLIPAKHLYTLRKGELVNDSIRGRLLPLESEMIKIKGRNRAWTCVFSIKPDLPAAFMNTVPWNAESLNAGIPGISRQRIHRTG